MHKKAEKKLCEICGRSYQIWNKSKHYNTKYHKVIHFYKLKFIDVNTTNTLKNIY